MHYGSSWLKPRAPRRETCPNLSHPGSRQGSCLEFLGHRLDDAELDDVLAMKGGGVFRVAPGQVTDDGELTLALARALVGEQSYPREKVATT